MGGGPRATTGLVAGGAGLILMVGSTLLPWLTSGETVRNSYQAIAALRRLTPAGDGVTGVLLSTWPGLGPAAAVVVLLVLIGWRRAAIVFAALLAVIVGTVSGLAVVTGVTGGSVVYVNVLGPATGVVGAVSTLAGAVLIGRSSTRTGAVVGGGDAGSRDEMRETRP